MAKKFKTHAERCLAEIAESGTGLGVGVHVGIAEHVYRKHPGLNKSIMDHAWDRSMMHMFWEMNHPGEKTQAMTVGDGLHLLTLQGIAAYEAAYRIADTCSSVTGGGDRCKSQGSLLGIDNLWYCKTHARKIPTQSMDGIYSITSKDNVLIDQWHQALMREDLSRVFIKDAGDNEVMLVWIDEETQVLCKCKIDMIRAGWQALGDIKTTENAEMTEFSKSIAEYGYDRQAAWYLDGAKACKIPINHFMIIPVEKKEPFGVSVHPVSLDAIEQGRDCNRLLIREIARCFEVGVWPGYRDQLQPIAMPRYAVEQRKKKCESIAEWLNPAAVV